MAMLEDHWKSFALVPTLLMSYNQAQHHEAMDCSWARPTAAVVKAIPHVVGIISLGQTSGLMRDQKCVNAGPTNLSVTPLGLVKK